MIHGVNYRATLPRRDRPAAGLRQPTPLINGNTGSNDGMLEGARRGYDAFDFLAGDDQYKRVLSTHHNVVYWMNWRRPSFKFRLLDGLRSLRKM